MGGGPSQLYRKRLLANLNPTPEGDVVLDVARRRLGIRVVPGRIRILLPVNQEAVVPRLPLPWAARCRRTRPQELPLHCLFRKVNISLDHLVGITLSECVAVPYCLRHVNAPAIFSIGYDDRRQLAALAAEVLEPRCQ